MVEQCDTECETTGGAIFCNGQFLNVADIDDCAAELTAEIDIHVDLDIAADVDVDINPPKASTPDDDGDTIFNCAFRPIGAAGSTNAGLPALGFVAALWAARRLRRSGSPANRRR